MHAHSKTTELRPPIALAAHFPLNIIVHTSALSSVKLCRFRPPGEGNDGLWL